MNDRTWKVISALLRSEPRAPCSAGHAKSSPWRADRHHGTWPGSRRASIRGPPHWGAYVRPWKAGVKFITAGVRLSKAS